MPNELITGFRTGSNLMQTIFDRKEDRRRHDIMVKDRKVGRDLQRESMDLRKSQAEATQAYNDAVIEMKKAEFQATKDKLAARQQDVSLLDKARADLRAIKSQFPYGKKAFENIADLERTYGALGSSSDPAIRAQYNALQKEASEYVSGSVAHAKREEIKTLISEGYLKPTSVGDPQAVADAHVLSDYTALQATANEAGVEWTPEMETLVSGPAVPGQSGIPLGLQNTIIGMIAKEKREQVTVRQSDTETVFGPQHTTSFIKKLSGPQYEDMKKKIVEAESAAAAPAAPAADPASGASTKISAFVDRIKGQLGIGTPAPAGPQVYTETQNGWVYEITISPDGTKSVKPLYQLPQ